jgi:hypothetical protein
MKLCNMQPRNPGTQQSARGLRGGTSWLSGVCFGLRTHKTQKAPPSPARPPDLGVGLLNRGIKLPPVGSPPCSTRRADLPLCARLAPSRPSALAAAQVARRPASRPLRLPAVFGRPPCSPHYVLRTIAPRGALLVGMRRRRKSKSGFAASCLGEGLATVWV